MPTSPFPVFNFDDFDKHSLLLAKVCQKLEIENKNSKNEVSFESFNCKKWNKKLLKITRFLYLVFNMYQI
jgi:hypothetical protein